MSELQCLICYNEPKQPIITQCGHTFCWKCIKDKVPGYCPFCGNPITLDSLVSIFNEDGTNAPINNKVNNSNEDQDNINQRPAQHYETSEETLFTTFLNLFNLDSNPSMTVEQERQLFTIPRWFVLGIICVVSIFILLLWMN
ncbi:zinc finger domain containing protein [Entamoeba histolytica HM-1:IMSS-B]|uniref:RING-type E3 ubiquitin transferase n=5 Tax=Entamoeba histolytica TaxID=5759 RepID=C4M5X7_ENTH1|nr:zinc finger domain containing protein [Entamoeba histolytica HM-1:IMSS]EMH72576.1 zinc finger domain containing protein [Entamoeba histolytica HM-1:IMSS-B]EMS13677.1 zinc finger domain containing protein [Entamoeba histolytica HM-3:IMSS]ENY61597.1 zinc finger domain containing protein [Entamoeba histolytica HM-1:IMSS-A]GAT96848.1 zinc finger domain containing protein [Entamoeba histolytica]EAL47208.1 zinc finger domain containing protein [Entamoeba histolytica HM-1:IMSS]|eukprot:XP_652594.1 zinc finger domain containing protein [Entamoeba histolytica HM-1:IMSS]